MKVIIIKPYLKHKVNEIIDVPQGFGNNFLIKKGYAILATDDALHKANVKEAKQKESLLVEVKEKAALAHSLDGKEITIKAKSGKDNSIFGAISTKQVVKEIKSQLNVDIDKHDILTKNPINHLGYHNIEVKLHSQIKFKIKVHVIDESN